jgi:outer membrane protein OmpA-like peptidoglycan-associated protein
VQILALLCALGSLFSIQTYASETPKNWLFVGGNIGYLQADPDSSHPFEVKKSGPEGVIKIVGSHYFDHWVLDLGAGWAYSYLTQENLSNSSAIKVITRSLLVELSPRVTFGPHWQVGPLVQYLSGADVSYDENGIVDELSGLWRGGLRVQYELGNEYRWRVGAQGFTDLNNSGRTLLGIGLDIQFGFAPGFRAPATEEVSTPMAAATPVPTPEFAEVHGENIRLYLGEKLLRFKTAKSELDAPSQRALNKLAPILSQHESAWKNLRIEGHTDIRNANGQNQVLSEHRAQAVKDLLVKAKLPEAKLTTTGLAATQPIDPAHNAHAYSTNRRVEIWLDQVDPAQIPQIMAELNAGIR